MPVAYSKYSKPLRQDRAPLSPAEGQRVRGFGPLLGQRQTMVRESGNPEGFDAASWLSAWMTTPVPALGGARPLDLMDTMTGQALVSPVHAQCRAAPTLEQDRVSDR